MRFTLKKSEILRGSKNLERLLRNSKKIEGSFLRCYVASEPRVEGQSGAGGVAVAFAVKKTLKRAVDRNRVRRLMREAYRLNKATLLLQAQHKERQIRIIFMYSHPGKGASILPPFSSIQEDIVTLLETISKALVERS